MTTMTNSEIWDGWCGSASPLSDEGSFATIVEALDYVHDRQADWASEEYETVEDDDGNETVRHISDMTEDETQEVARAILQYHDDAVRASR